MPEVNDLVIIYEEKVPRQQWCVGRIIEILPGRDGHIRGAKVFVGRTKTILERPINKLYPIEFAKESNLSQDELKIKSSVCENTVEVIRIKHNPIIEQNKRNAAIRAKQKIKYMV